MIQFLSSLFILSSFSLSSPALASEEVRFTNKELDAAFVLMRPELNTLELNGKTGVYTPSPSLKYLKVERTEFNVDLSGIASLVNIEFNHLRAKAPTVMFDNGEFVLSVPLVDQDYALQSRVGSISVEGVSLNAHFRFQTGQNNLQELVLDSTGLTGALYGSGLLSSGFILGRVRSIFLNVLAQQLNQILAKSNVQEAIRSGLLNWSGFYTGDAHTAIVPGSLQVFNENEVTGIRYQVD